MRINYPYTSCRGEMLCAVKSHEHMTKLSHESTKLRLKQHISIIYKISYDTDASIDILNLGTGLETEWRAHTSY